jgi:hypothetical protein
MKATVKHHIIKTQPSDAFKDINNEIAPNRLLGVKTASAAVLLSFVVFVAYYKLLNQIFHFKADDYVLIIALDSLSIICTITVACLLSKIRKGLLKERVYIYAANSIYVEIFAEWIACVAEIFGLIFQIICLATNGDFEHSTTKDFVYVVSNMLQALELIALPCCTLALSLVMHRLFERVKESNLLDHERIV